MNIFRMLFPNGKIKALTLSYDDAVIHDKRLVDIMVKNGLKGTFNVCSGRFGNGGEYKLSAQEVKELYMSNGMEIAVHGLYHRFMTELPDGVRVYEVIKDREVLEQLTGDVVRGMAYAFGNYSDKTVRTLQDAGFAYARTTVSTEKFDVPTDWLRMPATCHHRNPRLFELAEKFINYDEPTPWRKKAQLFYLWGHSYEFNDNDNWDVIERFAEMTGNRDDVWYATNIEIYNYVNAYNNLVYSLDALTVYNPSFADVWVLDGETGNTVCLKAGTTTKIR